MRARSVASTAAISACLDTAPALDLLGLGLLLVGDAGIVDQPFLGDARPFGLFAGTDLGGIDRLLALDLALADLALGMDARLAHLLFLGDALLFDVFTRGDLGALGLGLALGTLARQFGALLGAAELDVALLLEAGFLALALDIQRLLFGLEVAGADPDHRVLLDVVAQLAAVLDVLDQAGQALGIEAVGRIEEFKLGLVDILDGDRFQLQSVEVEAFLGQSRLTRCDIDAALLVHLVHGHLGGDRAHARR